jgi:RHS repeat-associated protein
MFHVEQLKILDNFTNHEYDEILGIYYAKARFYDPVTMRFMAIDPIRDGTNWYMYAGNNPMRYTDPLGLEPAVDDLVPQVFSSNLRIMTRNRQKPEDILSILQELTDDTLAMKYPVEDGYDVVVDGYHVYIADIAENVSKPVGTELVRNILSGNHPVTIKETTRGWRSSANNSSSLSNGIGEDAEVYANLSFYPKLYETIIYQNEGGNPYGIDYEKHEVAAEITLGHELIHALHYTNGSYSRGKESFYSPIQKKTIREEIEELVTVGLPYVDKNGVFHKATEGAFTENKLRKEHGYNERSIYTIRP